MTKLLLLAALLAAATAAPSKEGTKSQSPEAVPCNCYAGCESDESCCDDCVHQSQFIGCSYDRVAGRPFYICPGSRNLCIKYHDGSPVDMCPPDLYYRNPQCREWGHEGRLTYRVCYYFDPRSGHGDTICLDNTRGATGNDCQSSGGSGCTQINVANQRVSACIESGNVCIKDPRGNHLPPCPQYITTLNPRWVDWTHGNVRYRIVYYTSGGGGFCLDHGNAGNEPAFFNCRPYYG